MNKRGITFIMLVITVGIMAILATTTILMLSGANTIDLANEAVVEELKLSLTETAGLIDYDNKVDRRLGVATEFVTLKQIADSVGYSEEELTRVGVVLDGLYLKFNEEVLYIFSEGSVEEDSSPLTNNGVDNASKVYAPKLTDNLFPVKFDTTLIGIETVPTDSSWYAYTAQNSTTPSGGTSKWANAVTKNSAGEVTGYFVWIPRFAYKINYTNPDNIGAGGTIDIIFIDINNLDENSQPLPSGYIVHPAFTDGTSNEFKNGEWDSEITGFWFSKYEAGIYNTQYPVFLPNVSTAGTKTIKQSFDAALSMKSNFTLFTGYIGESHMSKNSEWGAVAYLTHSKYGRNTTAIQPNTNLDNKYLSASSGDLTSTTGNKYGVYDMAGNTTEYVSAYVVNYKSGMPSITGSNQNKSTKYNTVYNVGVTDWYTDNLEANLDRIGDAVIETRNWAQNNLFPYNYMTVFHRGGFRNSMSQYGVTGVFYFNAFTGSVNTMYSWRSVLIIE